MFDGVQPTITSTDKRITILRMNKVGIKNHAGSVRNEAIKYVTTEWVGFVDDDDTLTPCYVDRFLSHVKEDIDVIIFRMNLDDRILPPLNHATFHINYVGISFAVKTSLFHEGFWFEPSSAEDFYLLDRYRSERKHIMISPHVTYLVRK